MARAGLRRPVSNAVVATVLLGLLAPVSADGPALPALRGVTEAPSAAAVAPSSESILTSAGTATVPDPDEEELIVIRRAYHSPANQAAKAWGEACFGCFLLLTAFPVLWFNEKRQVKMWELFGRAHSIARPDVSSRKVDPENEARLVHVPGVTATADVLKDEAFGISVTGCAKLQRQVQMYQWVEHSRTEKRDTPMGGKEEVTTYTYSMEWRSNEVDSSGFQESGHHNPTMVIQQLDKQAFDVSLGSFRLPDELVGRMCAFRSLSAEELPQSVEVSGQHLRLDVGSAHTYTTEAQGAAPRLGDLRVTFRKVPCGPATVLAVQHGQSFVPLTYGMRVEGGRVVHDAGGSAPLLGKRSTAAVLDAAAKREDELAIDAAGCCACCAVIGKAIESKEEIFELAEEELTLATIIKRAEDSQPCWHLVLQILGYLMFFFGLLLIFSFIPTVFRFIPFLGVWIELFGKIIATVAAFLGATFLWCTTVAVAWFAARPNKALLLIFTAILLISLPNLIAH